MKAVLCSVCTGSGIVAEGFYRRISDTWTNSGGTEQCRSCEGKGHILLKMLTTPDFPDPMFYFEGLK